MKTVLFINSGFELGGIETFISRAAKKLNGKIKFKLLLMSDSVNADLVARFRMYGEVFFLKDYIKFNFIKYAIIRTLLPLNKEKLKILLDDVDIIHASCSFSLMLMKRLNYIDDGRSTECVGVYHSREFLWRGRNSIMRSMQVKYFNEMPACNVIFMNDFTCQLYSKLWGKKYSKTLPIGIDTDIYKKCEPDFSSKRIVSIGRLVDFKTYNALMISTLASLGNTSNIKYSFEIYGDGPERENLEKLGCELKVNVKFYGGVSYDELPNILNGAFLFVGCGTAIVEAAAAGVPSIIGIESEKECVSHGFLVDTKGLSFQEKGLKLPLHSYKSLLDKISSMDVLEYTDFSASHRIRADDFSLSRMEIAILDYYNSLELTKSKYISFKYFLSTLYWLAMNKLGLISERKTMYDI